MENQDFLPQPTTELFSRAVAAQGQGRKKKPLNSTVQGHQSSQGVPSLMSLELRGSGSVGSSSLINQNLNKQEPVKVTTSTVPSGLSETTVCDLTLAGQDEDIDLLKQRIFAARMMGAPATVANNIVNIFPSKDSNTSSSSVSYDSKQPVVQVSESQALGYQIQKQLTSSVPPAQQAQARMIAAALFNTIKPMLPVANTTTAQASPQVQQQQQQHPSQLQQTLQHKSHTQQPLKSQQEPQRCQPNLQQTLSQHKLPQQQSLERHGEQQYQAPLQLQLQLQQLQQETVKTHQQQSSGATGVGQAHPQRWSNRAQSSAAIQNQQYSTVKSTSGMSNNVEQKDSTVSKSSLSATVNLTSQSLGLLGPTGITDSAKLKLFGKAPVSVGLPSEQTFEVLQSLKNDGYIDSPLRQNISRNNSTTKSKTVDDNSTNWPGTLKEDDWKLPKPVPKPKDFTVGIKTTVVAAKAVTDSPDLQGKIHGSKPSKSIPNSANTSGRSTTNTTGGTWQANVDAFLQATNRGVDSKWEASRGKQP